MDRTILVRLLESSLPSNAPTPHHVTGLLHPAFGPLVRVTLRGWTGKTMNGVAILDTGASKSAVDREVAARLQLTSPGVASWQAVTDRGERAMSPLRRGTLALTGTVFSQQLDFVEVPGLAAKVQGYPLLVLLGWDMLTNCRLQLDGPAGTFKLQIPVATGRRRARRRR